jgi:hypothetical protein
MKKNLILIAVVTSIFLWIFHAILLRSTDVGFIQGIPMCISIILGVLITPKGVTADKALRIQSILSINTVVFDVLAFFTPKPWPWPSHEFNLIRSLIFYGGSIIIGLYLWFLFKKKFQYKQEMKEKGIFWVFTISLWIPVFFAGLWFLQPMFHTKNIRHETEVQIKNKDGQDTIIKVASVPFEANLKDSIVLSSEAFFKFLDGRKDTVYEYTYLRNFTQRDTLLREKEMTGSIVGLHKTPK